MIEREENYKNRQAMWKCICECGNQTIVIGNNLRTGHTTSCGCFHAQQASKIHTTHGLTKSKTYKIWEAMKARCENPNNASYINYGNRGITISEEWQSFENFYKDMGKQPAGLSLDRIDNNQGYSKDNCRWANNTEQQNNTRKNVFIEFKGKLQTVAQWAREYNIRPNVIHTRLKFNWDIEKIFTTPVKQKRRKEKSNGQTKV